MVDLFDVEVLRNGSSETTPRPVVDVSGGVAELHEIPTARHVADAPDRLARHREHHMACANSGDLTKRSLGIGDVLEHLDGQHQIERVVVESKCRGITELSCNTTARPLFLQMICRKIDAPCLDTRKTVHDTTEDLAFAHSDLEHTRRPKRCEQPVERGEEVRHHAPLDGVLRGVFVVVVARGSDLTRLAVHRFVRVAAIGPVGVRSARLRTS